MERITQVLLAFGIQLGTLVALLTKWRPRTPWVRSVFLGIVGFIGTGYLTAAAGWYFALSGIGLLVVATVGGAVAAGLVPGLIAPGQRSKRLVGFATRGSTPIR